jgi:fission process protein 1
MASIRPLAYASELGESVRPLVPPILVKILYGVSWGYVFLDTGLKTFSVENQGRSKMIIYGFDTLVWHCLASMLIPAYVIHSLVHYSELVIRKYAAPSTKFGRYGPTIIGLSSIPFIIHPIDHLGDFIMNNTLRRGYNIPVSSIQH